MANAMTNYKTVFNAIIKSLKLRSKGKSLVEYLTDRMEYVEAESRILKVRQCNDS